jgi:nucleotide-binding universal stress UspA family protein
MEACDVKLKRIMASMDLSSYSEITFLHALALAKALGGELTLLNVINSRGLEQIERLGAQGFGISKEQYIDTIQKERSAEFEKVYLPRTEGVPCRVMFRVGLPWEQIVKTIRQEKTDLVVMGTKGRSNLAGALFGSTADKVFRHAPCPVVSVRGPEHCRLPE